MYSRTVCALVLLWATYGGLLAQTCAPLENFRHVEFDQAITGSTYITLHTSGLLGCAKQCLLRTACHSINYDPASRECQLNRENNSTSNVTSRTGTLYSDVAMYPDKLAGVCSPRSCPDTSVCREHVNGAVCETECPDPILEDGYFTSLITRNVGNIVSFQCSNGFRPSGSAACQPNGTWTEFSCTRGCETPPNISNADLLSNGTKWLSGEILEYKCRGPLEQAGNVSCLADGTWTLMKCVARNCSTMLQCNSSYTDGEYWLYPEALYDEPVKIYCHGMNTTEPMEYLTLPEENSMDYSGISCDPLSNIRIPYQGCSYTRFNKLRITDIAQLRTNGLKDYTFTNGSTCFYTVFGTVNDCYAHTDCQKQDANKMVIDTKGTGLIVDPLQVWLSESQDTTILKPLRVERSHDGRVISLLCHQRCTWCSPFDGTYKFVIDELFQPNITSATLPSCGAP